MNNKQLISSVFFFISLFLLLACLGTFIRGLSFNFLFFWIFVTIPFVCILYQILSLKSEELNVKLVLLEILILSFYLSFILRILTDFSISPSDDTYTLLTSTIYIENHNYFLSGTAPDYSKWFQSPLLLLINAKILNISLKYSYFTLPNLIITFGPFFLYLIGKEMFENDKIALLGSLLLVSLSQYAYQTFQVHPQFLAIVYSLTSIFVFFKILNTEKKILWTIIFFLFVTLTIATNYTTSFFLCWFFISVLIAQISLKHKGDILALSKEGIKNKIRTILHKREIIKHTKINPSYTLLILIITIFLAYHIYIGISAFESTILISKDLSEGQIRIGKTSSSLGFLEKPLKDKFYNIGINFYILIFSLIILIGLFRLKNKKKKLFGIYSSLVYSSIGLLLYIIIFFTSSNFINLGTSRVMVFFFPIAFLLLAYCIRNLKINKKNFYMLLVGFFIVNIGLYPFLPSNLIDNQDKTELPWFFDGSQEISSFNWYNSHSLAIITGPENLAHIFRFESKEFKAPFSSITYNNLSYNKNFTNLKDTNIKLIILFSGRLSTKNEVDLIDSADKSESIQKVFDNGEWIAYTRN